MRRGIADFDAETLMASPALWPAAGSAGSAGGAGDEEAPRE
jgi:hypothetical protein